MEKAKLLLQTFDAQLTELKIAPKCLHTKVSYKLKMYDEDTGRRVARVMRFEDVAAIGFHMNYFDCLIGSEGCGFYEIFARDKKVELLEENFIRRRNDFLFPGGYNYDAEDPHDLLNYREPMEDILREIDQYRLFQQQTTGGTYTLLAKQWAVN